MNLDEAVERATQPIADAIAAGLLPGSVFGVATGSGERWVVVHGRAQVEPEPVAMTRETFFDLASLTKPLFTTMAVLELVADGSVELDQPLAEYVPDLRQHDLAAPERQLTIRQCLTHQTFLPAVEPLYTLGLEPATLEAYVLQHAWPVGPPVYSDINFILLGIVVERVGGVPLAARPLPEGLSFTPTPERCAATERCPWRRRMLRGEVHDENAYAFGGVAGHAGLFGTVDGTLNLLSYVLREAPDACSPLHGLVRRETPERTLGWQVAHPGWSGGGACSQRAIGHNGFTGTGAWIDFDRGVAWTLLTNRVHPTRHRPSVTVELRPAVGELLLR